MMKHPIKKTAPWWLYLMPMLHVAHLHGELYLRIYRLALKHQWDLYALRLKRTDWLYFQLQHYGQPTHITIQLKPYAICYLLSHKAQF